MRDARGEIYGPPESFETSSTNMTTKGLRRSEDAVNICGRGRSTTRRPSAAERVYVERADDDDDLVLPYQKRAARRIAQVFELAPASCWDCSPSSAGARCRRPLPRRSSPRRRGLGGFGEQRGDPREICPVRRAVGAERARGGEGLAVVTEHASDSVISTNAGGSNSPSIPIIS